MPSLKHFLEFDGVLDVYTTKTHEADCEHQVLALAHFYVYYFYTILHSAGCQCKVFTSGDFKHFNGDYTDCSYGYRRFPTNPAPADFNGPVIRFAATKKYDPVENAITVSPCRPITFHDGTCVVPQDKPNRSIRFRVGTGQDYIDIFVDKRLRDVMKYYVNLHPHDFLAAPRKTPSVAPLYHVCDPIHTTQKRTRVKFGAVDPGQNPFHATDTIWSIWYAFTCLVQEMQVYLATCFNLGELIDRSLADSLFAPPVIIRILWFFFILISHLNGYTNLFELLSAIQVVLSVVLFPRYKLPEVVTLTTNLVIVITYAINYDNYYMIYLLALTLGRYCIAFMWKKPVRRVLIYYAFIAILIYDRFGFLKERYDFFSEHWSYLSSLPATNMNKFVSAVVDCLYLVSPIPPPEPSWKDLLLDYIQKNWRWTVGYILLVWFSIERMYAGLKCVAYAVTAESSHYFELFSPTGYQRCLNVPIRILPLKFVQGYCSDRVAYINQGIEYERLSESKPKVDETFKGVIIGMTRHGVSLRCQNIDFDKELFFPVVYYDNSETGHMMVGILNSNKDDGRVRDFVDTWNAAFDNNYRLIRGARTQDGEAVISNGDVFCSEYFSLTGPTYKLSQYHPGRIHIPSSIATRFLVNSKITNATVETIARDNNLSTAMAFKYYNIMRALTLSGQLFVPREASILEASPATYLFSRGLARLSVALLTRTSIVILIYLLILGLIMPAWLPSRMTLVITSVQNKFTYCLTTLASLIPAAVRKLSSRLYSHVRASYGSTVSPQSWSPKDNFEGSSMMYSDRQNYPTLVLNAISQTGKSTFFEVELPQDVLNEMKSCPGFTHSFNGSATIIVACHLSWITVLSPSTVFLSTECQTIVLKYLKSLTVSHLSNLNHSPMLTPEYKNKIVQFTTYLQKSTQFYPSLLTELKKESSNYFQLTKDCLMKQPVNSSTNKGVHTVMPAQLTYQDLIDVCPLNCENSSQLASMLMSLSSHSSLPSKPATYNTLATTTPEASTQVNAVHLYLLSLLSVVFKKVCESKDTISDTLIQEMTTLFSATHNLLLMSLSESFRITDWIAVLKDLLKNRTQSVSAPATISSPENLSPTPPEQLEKPLPSSPIEEIEKTSLPDSALITSPVDSHQYSVLSCFMLLRRYLQDNPVTNFIPQFCANLMRSIGSMAKAVSKPLENLRNYLNPMKLVRPRVYGGVSNLEKMKPTNDNSNVSSQDMTLMPLSHERSTMMMTSVTDPWIITPKYFATLDISMPTRKNSNRNRRKNNSNNNQKGISWRRAARLTRSVYSSKSVRAGVVLETSHAFSRTVLDPAHVKDYNPVGIPDNHVGKVLCNKAVYTATLTDVMSGATFYKVDNAGAYQTYSPDDNTVYNHIYLCQDDNPFMPFFALIDATDSSTDKKVQGVYFFPNSQLVAEDKSTYRLIARGMTIEQIGPYNQRGGFCTCYRLMNNTVSDSTNDKAEKVVSVSEIEANAIETFDGIRGVYSINRPGVEQNYVQWKHYDASVPYTFQDYSGVKIAEFSRGGVLNLSAAMSFNVVKLSPSAAFKLADSTFNFRITASEAVEYESNTQIGQNVDAEPRAIEMVLALTPHIPCFYPASYNDLRQILGRVKQAYTKNRDLVEAALDAITPDRRTQIVKFLDQLATRF